MDGWVFVLESSEIVVEPVAAVGLRPLSARERISTLADPGSHAPVSAELDAPRASAHLARRDIAAQPDDGVVVARIRVHGLPVLIAAQDERFIAGTVGAAHGGALAALFTTARTERPAAIVLLAASAGVRLHEANPAELALARAIAAALDASAAEIPFLALAVGDVYGGTSVLACAAERTAMLTGTHMGLSGPRVLEMARGAWELDASDARAVASVYGAAMRSSAVQVEHVLDDAEVVRSWIALGARGIGTFAERVAATQDRLATRLRAYPRATPSFEPSALFADADPVDASGWLWRVRGEPVWLTRSLGAASFGPAEAHALDTALLAEFPARADASEATLVIVEDSGGHPLSRPAELQLASRFLAQHAAVLALLRARGMAIVGLLTGIGHSAAFFVNALQAPTVFALDGARVVAMEPDAIARVLRMPAEEVTALIEDDPLLGQPVRCFASWGGVASVLPGIDRAALMEIARAARARPK